MDRCPVIHLRLLYEINDSTGTYVSAYACRDDGSLAHPEPLHSFDGGPWFLADGSAAELWVMDEISGSHVIESLFTFHGRRRAVRRFLVDRVAETRCELLPEPADPRSLPERPPHVKLGTPEPVTRGPTALDRLALVERSDEMDETVRAFFKHRSSKAYIGYRPRLGIDIPWLLVACTAGCEELRGIVVAGNFDDPHWDLDAQFTVFSIEHRGDGEFLRVNGWTVDIDVVESVLPSVLPPQS